MNRKPFQYSLGPTASTYYQVVDKQVQVVAAETPLRFDLVEWEATEILYKRSPTYSGIFREMTIPATFAKDGATILRHVFWTQGTEGACFFTIKRLNTTTQLYELVSVQSIDFTQFTDTPQTVAVKLKDVGLGMVLKAKETTVYEVPITGTDAVAMYLDGVNLRGNAHYVIPQQGDVTPYTLSNTLIIAAAGAEGLNEAIQINTSPQPQPSNLSLDKSAIYQAKYKEDFTTTVKDLQIYVSWPSSANAAYTPTLLHFHGLASTFFTKYLWQAPAPLSPGQDATYTIPLTTYSGTINPDEKIGLAFAMLSSGGAAVNSTASRFQVIPKDGQTATIDISSEYRRPVTLAAGLRHKTVLEKLVAKLPGGPYTVQSDYLTKQNFYHHGMAPRNVIFTSGDAIRQLGTPTKPDKLKITLADLQKDGESRCFAGIGAEGDTLRFEHQSYFYRNDIMILDEPLAEVTDFEATVATDYLWNTLKIGYPNESTDKLNGKGDPLLQAQYATPGLWSNNDLDLVSPYSASYVTHETLRANLAGKKTTDSNSDDSVQLIEVEDNPITFTLPFNNKKYTISAYLPARRQNDTGGSISGVIAGTSAYNIGLTYARCVQRNGPRVRTCMNGVLDSASLTFQTAEQNSELVSKLGQDPQIVERADIQASTLDAPLYLPIIFSFNAPLPKHLREKIEANPYGKIPFYYRGKVLSGFIEEIGIKPAVNDSRGWKLLAAPDTDLSVLVH